MVLSLIHSILLIMTQFKVASVSQLEVFKVQFQQFLIRNEIISCLPDRLVIDKFEILFHNNRLVKRPGYEIFLQNMTDGKFRCDEDITLVSRVEGELHEISFKIP